MMVGVPETEMVIGEILEVTNAFDVWANDGQDDEEVECIGAVEIVESKVEVTVDSGSCETAIPADSITHVKLHESHETSMGGSQWD